MKKLILILFALIIFSSIVIAEDPLYVYDDKEDIDLKINCLYSDYTLCNSTVNCYITINDPDTTNIVKNATMTYNDVYYNYTLQQKVVERNFGEYAISAYCDSGSESSLTSYTILISSENSRFPTYVLLLIILCFIYFLLVLGIWKDEIVTASLASMGLIVIGIYMHMNGMGDIKNWMTDMFALVNIAIGAFILLKTWGEEAVNQLGG